MKMDDQRNQSIHLYIHPLKGKRVSSTQAKETTRIAIIMNEGIPSNSNTKSSHRYSPLINVAVKQSIQTALGNPTGTAKRDINHARKPKRHHNTNKM